MVCVCAHHILLSVRAYVIFLPMCAYVICVFLHSSCACMRVHDIPLCVHAWVCLSHFCLCVWAISLIVCHIPNLIFTSFYFHYREEQNRPIVGNKSVSVRAPATACSAHPHTTTLIAGTVVSSCRISPSLIKAFTKATFGIVFVSHLFK